jgi:hypothetical protein
MSVGGDDAPRLFAFVENHTVAWLSHVQSLTLGPDRLSDRELSKPLRLGSEHLWDNYGVTLAVGFALFQIIGPTVDGIMAASWRRSWNRSTERSCIGCGVSGR